jgi:hypothetical protein
MSETTPHIPPQEDDTTPVVASPTLPKKRSFVRRVGRFLLWTVLTFILIFLIVAFSLRIPSVQHWVIEKTTTYLSIRPSKSAVLASISSTN